MLFKYEPGNLIKQVKIRPGIWDYNHPAYKSLALRNELWNDLVMALLEPDVKVDKSEMRELVIQLQKKWKGLKDTFLKQYKANKPYIHSKRLRFLAKNIEKNNESDEDVTNAEGGSSESEDSPKWTPARRTCLKYSNDENSNDENNGTVSFITNDMEPPSKMARMNASDFVFATADNPTNNTTYEEDPDRMFLLSLLPDFKEIPQSDKFKAKLEIMHVIEKYKNHFSLP